jgi:hypothetical protein
MISLAIRTFRAGAFLIALFGFAAAAQAQSASHLQAAREVAEITGAGKAFETALPQIFKQVYETYTQQNPDLQRDISGVMQSLIDEFKKRESEIVGIVAQSFAAKFTEAELKEMLAFYNSPIGKKLVSENRAVLQDAYGKVQDWSGKQSQLLINRLKEEMKKKGHTI